MTRSCTLAIFLALFLHITPSWAQQHTLTILHINDSHSNLMPSGPRTAEGAGTVGGIARAATVIQNERLGSDPVMVLHAGDVFIGDPMYNFLYDQPAELSILASLGIDAMAVGNHEFDLTPATLMLALHNTLGDTPAFPLLSANVDLSDTAVAALSHYIKAGVIKEYSGFKVGIFGLTTPSTNDFSLPAPVVVLKDSLLTAKIEEQVTDLRAQGCDIVICLSHMGYEADKIIAYTIPGIDVIVSGHDHIAFPQPIFMPAPDGDSTIIVETAGFYRQIGRLKLVVDNGKVSMASYELIDLDQSVPEDPMVSGLLDMIVDGIEQVIPGLFSQPIAMCTGFLTEETLNPYTQGKHDTHVGNLVADAFATVTGADIGLQPGGSTAQPLYAGPILPVDVFRMIGYGFNETNGIGFRVVTLKMSGMALWMALEGTIAEVRSNDEMLIQVSSSLSYTYDPSNAFGNRLQQVQYNGEPLNTDSTYTIATNELVADFLGTLGIPFSDRALFNDLTEFEVLVGYILNLGTITADTLPGRVQATSTVGIHAPRTPSVGGMQLEAAPFPFSSETMITLSIDNTASVQITIHDLLGRRIASIAEGRYSEGRHTFAWHASQLAPGMYFCIAQSSEGTTAVMPLIKTR